MNKAEYFVSQWGCEQTNVTFYKVLKRTAKTVTIIEVLSKRIATKWGEYTATPTDEIPNWARVMRKKIHNYSTKKEKSHEQIEINNFSSAFIWDGEAVEGTNYA